MTAEEMNKVYAQKLKVINKKYHDDEEVVHREADAILCELLTKIGFTDVVEEYDNIKKYYS
jgi:hypothetical protein